MSGCQRVCNCCTSREQSEVARGRRTPQLNLFKATEASKRSPIAAQQLQRAVGHVKARISGEALQVSPDQGTVHRLADGGQAGMACKVCPRCTLLLVPLPRTHVSTGMAGKQHSHEPMEPPALQNTCHTHLSHGALQRLAARLAVQGRSCMSYHEP